MRFATVHKFASYLLVAAGFAALALSGELAPPVIALTVLTSAMSWFFDPHVPRARFLHASWWNAAWTTGTVAIIALLGLSALRGESVLLVGAYALTALLVNKLWNRRTSRDWLQAYVVSFLMLIAGTVLNSDLAFALCFVVYVIAATWALTLFHLRREMEENYLLKHGDQAGAPSEMVEVARVLNSRRVVGGSFLAGTSAISASVFVISGTFFFLFPRVGFNVFFTHARRGMTVGFNDRGVELGGNGLIKDNDQVVMRVEFPESPAPRGPQYMRGISFDKYENGRWTPSRDTTDRRPLLRRQGMSLVGVPQQMKRATEPMLARLHGAIRQDVYLEPMDASVLFLMERPVGVSVPQSRPGGPVMPNVEGSFHDKGGHYSTDDVFAFGRAAGIKYSAWSRLDPPSDKELREARDATSEELEALASDLDVAGVPPEVLELGRKLTQGKHGPYEKALAVRSYLQSTYKYTIDLQHDPSKEPLAEFLFERKQGHCEYFASAMAMLMRAAGVPARHVAGFYGGEWNEVGHYLQIRQRDAHAWVEVWLGPLGWMPFDPTPAAPGQGEASSVTSRLRQMLDVVQLAWFKYVIEYDLTTQMDLFMKFRRAASDWKFWKSEKKDGAPSEPFWTAAHARAAGAVTMLAGLALLLWKWRRPRGKGSRTPRAARATAALRRAERALEKRGIPRGDSDTPRQVAARAVEQNDPGAEPFEELVEAYYEARFGPGAVDAEQVDRIARLADLVVKPPIPAAPPTAAPRSPTGPTI